MCYVLKKMNLYSTFEFRNSVNLFRTPIGLKICSGQTCTHSDHFQKKIPKISHCGSHSPKYIELNHFTLLFCRGRQRNVQRLERTYTAIVLLIKPFVWRRSRRRRRLGLLKLPTVSEGTIIKCLTCYTLQLKLNAMSKFSLA